MSEATDILTKIGEIYLKAMEHEKTARTSPEHIDSTKTAAEGFEEAAKLSEAASANTSLPSCSRAEAEAYAKYYWSCYYKALGWFWYEKRNTDAARDNEEQRQQFLKEAIDVVKARWDEFADDRHEHMEKMRNSWKAEQQASVVHLSAIRARENWDAGKPVEARDWYHRTASQAREAVEFLNTHDLDPTSERVMRGNMLGMIANAEQAIAKVLLGRLSQSGVQSLSKADDQLAVDLLAAFLRTLEAGKQAVQANIEWAQYQHAADQTISNIKTLLSDCRDRWPLFLIQFPNSPELRTFMNNIDAKTLRQANAMIEAERTPVGRLWAVGSFWLMVFVVVVGAIWLLLTIGWWSALLAVVSIPVLFLAVTAAILRSSGDLSEAGFLETLKLSLKFMTSGASRFVKPVDTDKGGE